MPTTRVCVGWEWKGRQVEVEASMLPAEHDVGIMGPYPEGLRLLEEDGTQIAITEEEHDELLHNEGLCDRLIAVYHEGDD